MTPDKLSRYHLKEFTRSCRQGAGQPSKYRKSLGCRDGPVRETGLAHLIDVRFWSSQCQNEPKRSLQVRPLIFCSALDRKCRKKKVALENFFLFFFKHTNDTYGVIIFDVPNERTPTIWGMAKLFPIGCVTEMWLLRVPSAPRVVPGRVTKSAQ